MMEKDTRSVTACTPVLQVRTYQVIYLYFQHPDVPPPARVRITHTTAYTSQHRPREPLRRRFIGPAGGVGREGRSTRRCWARGIAHPPPPPSSCAVLRGQPRPRPRPRRPRRRHPPRRPSSSGKSWPSLPSGRWTRPHTRLRPTRRPRPPHPRGRGRRRRPRPRPPPPPRPVARGTSHPLLARAAAAAERGTPHRHRRPRRRAGRLPVRRDRDGPQRGGVDRARFDPARPQGAALRRRLARRVTPSRAGRRRSCASPRSPPSVSPYES
mmetsp:Transcript_40494/g.127065  ORF Transcript_40494/g.127065 Transcript_40494/m.127065 type:complete len:268 (-) Transcript_40494:118-921(-)